MHPDTASRATSTSAVTPRRLFAVFLRIALSGIGGALPHARHAIVDVQGWLDDSEFADVLAAGQLLPGPNIVNVGILVGDRFCGLRGVAAALGGLLMVPFAIVVALGAFYRELGAAGVLAHAFTGISAAAAGLIVSVGLRLARVQPRRLWVLGIAMAAFVGVAVLRLPMVWVILALGPLAVVAANHEVGP
ncbi:MAG: chromate transporter [Burkholderiales bacterium]|nr:chromate transporter [Burkholderiales bacterium]